MPNEQGMTSTPRKRGVESLPLPLPVRCRSLAPLPPLPPSHSAPSRSRPGYEARSRCADRGLKDRIFRRRTKTTQRSNSKRVVVEHTFAPASVIAVCNMRTSALNSSVMCYVYIHSSIIGVPYSTECHLPRWSKGGARPPLTPTYKSWFGSGQRLKRLEHRSTPVRARGRAHEAPPPCELRISLSFVVRE